MLHFRLADELPVLQDIFRARVRACHRQLLWRLLVVQVPKHFLLLLSEVELRTPRLPPIGEEWERLGEALKNRCVAQNRPPEFSNRIPGLENTVLKLSYDLGSWRRLPDLDGVRVAMDLLGLEAAFEDQILHAIEAAAAAVVVVEAITLAERISCEILNF